MQAMKTELAYLPPRLPKPPSLLQFACKKLELYSRQHTVLPASFLVQFGGGVLEIWLLGDGG